MRTRGVQGVVLALFLVMLAWAGVSLAKELVMVSIVGPGIAGELDFDDPSTLEVFKALNYASASVAAPPGLAATYFIFYLAIGHEGEVVGTNVFHYYPSAGELPAYFYFADVRGGSSSAIGYWFELSAESELALRQLLAERGAAPRLADY